VGKPEGKRPLGRREEIQGGKFRESLSSSKNEQQEA
jgi:hypothetical protein